MKSILLFIAISYIYKMRNGCKNRGIVNTTTTPQGRLIFIPLSAVTQTFRNRTSF